MARSSLTLPFVVTVASSAAVLGACGNDVLVTSSSGAGGTTTSSATTTNGTSTGNSTGTTSGTSSVVSSSSTGNPSLCPDQPPSGFDQCDPSVGPCSYDIECQSGKKAFVFACGPEGWDPVAPDGCDGYPYDSCPGTELYCDGQWWLPHGTNPPAPCPTELPVDGSMCFAGGFGGTHQYCGYICQDDATWTIAQCAGSPGDEGQWVYDGACF